MQKNISLSLLFTLTSTVLFIACEDSTVMDVSLANIDKISDANLKSEPTQTSSVNIDNLSSNNILSSEKATLSSEETTLSLGSSEHKLISSMALSSITVSSEGTSSIASSSASTTGTPCETKWDASAKGGSGYSEGDIVSGSDNHNYQACEWTKSDPTTTTNMPKDSKDCGDWQDKGVWLDLGACN